MDAAVLSRTYQEKKAACNLQHRLTRRITNGQITNSIAECQGQTRERCWDILVHDANYCYGAHDDPGEEVEAYLDTFQ